ncbi:MAG: tetratricopeptide repeat protein [Shimia sp.]
MKTPTLTALVVALPAFAFAAGGGSSLPPQETETTSQCKDGQVFDEDTQECVMIEDADAALTPAERLEAVRELAYAGRYGDAQMLLGGLDQADDVVQTYWGFTHRKMGDVEAGMAAYAAALASNPDNLMVRSYLGQHYAETGQLVLARAELAEINARGGRETWPAKSLKWAIESGRGVSY